MLSAVKVVVLHTLAVEVGVVPLSAVLLVGCLGVRARGSQGGRAGAACRVGEQ